MMGDHFVIPDLIRDPRTPAFGMTRTSRSWMPDQVRHDDLGVGQGVEI
jgi:hypothetical protein